jgi:Tfp pilus assembly protein PilE
MNKYATIYTQKLCDHLEKSGMDKVGFTLVELLLALGAAGAVGTGAYKSFKQHKEDKKTISEAPGGLFGLAKKKNEQIATDNIARRKLKNVTPIMTTAGASTAGLILSNIAKKNPFIGAAIGAAAGLGGGLFASKKIPGPEKYKII